jgi:hypothetical protein
VPSVEREREREREARMPTGGGVTISKEWVSKNLFEAMWASIRSVDPQKIVLEPGTEECLVFSSVAKGVFLPNSEQDETGELERAIVKDTQALFRFFISGRGYAHPQCAVIRIDRCRDILVGGSIVNLILVRPPRTPPDVTGKSAGATGLHTIK